MRSGKTTLRRALQGIVDWRDSTAEAFGELCGDDGEGRTFWQAFGLRIGARRTGTFCLHADRADLCEEHRGRIQAHVARVCRGGRHLISDNAHLLNKIDYVAEALPQSKFILVVRALETVVSEWKVGFNKANTNNAEYPPFVHYWPEGEFPCWYVVQNDLWRPRITSASVRRWASRVARRVGLKKNSGGRDPSQQCKHERLSSFLKQYPDASRYYPGEGFCRLPEAWIKMNYNALVQLQRLSPQRWLPVPFEALLSQPHETLDRVCDFLNWPSMHWEGIPVLTHLQGMLPRPSQLTETEKQVVQEVARRHSRMVEALESLSSESRRAPSLQSPARLI